MVINSKMAMLLTLSLATSFCVAATQEQKKEEKKINQVVVQDDSGKVSKSKVVEIKVFPTNIIGKIKPMNAVNNGPNFCLDPNRRKESRTGRFMYYKQLRAPMARIHDARDMGTPHNHMCDINLIFTNWDADENDPANYDFTLTDWMMASIRTAGTEIMFRLGNSAEGMTKRYGATDVPKDFEKWARVAANIIRHYNEGWGWTTKDIPFKNQFNIRYWEIWNEADLGCPKNYFEKPSQYWKKNPRFWNGSPEQFFEFYAVVAKYLKKTFPDLKIGGPSVAGTPHWTEKFLEYCSANKVPIDFFSWHIYATRVMDVPAKSKLMRSLLEKYGYGSVETILNEWNWNTGWYGEEFRTSAYMRNEQNNFKIGAFYASVMSVMQNDPVDMLMYYDARLPTCWNGLFYALTQRPTKAYYPFYAWAKLRDLGSQIKVTGGSSRRGVYVVGAKGEDGKIGIYLSRYTFDANVVKGDTARIKIPGYSMEKAKCHLTDEYNQYTEVPLAILPDGSAELDLEPNMFAYIEVEQ